MKNTFVFNKGIFMDTHPLFDGERFESWKVIIEIFIRANDFEMCDFLISFIFITTFCLMIK